MLPFVYMYRLLYVSGTNYQRYIASPIWLIRAEWQTPTYNEQLVCLYRMNRRSYMQKHVRIKYEWYSGDLCKNNDDNIGLKYYNSSSNNPSLRRRSRRRSVVLEDFLKFFIALILLRNRQDVLRVHHMSAVRPVELPKRQINQLKYCQSQYISLKTQKNENSLFERL